MIPLPPNRYFAMQALRREFPGLLPLARIGIMDYLAPMQRYRLYSGKLEWCLRFSPEDNLSYDVIDGVRHRTPFPNIFVKTPAMLHGTRIERSRNAVFFAYDPALYDRMKALGLLEPPFIWQFRMTPEIAAALSRITELTGQLMEYGAADRIDLLALQLLESLILKRNHSAATHYEREVEHRIRRIASYLQLHFLQPIDIPKLYRQNGFSRRNFFRCWNRHYELPPARYVLKLKLDYARSQLRETNLPVGEISRELNFRNRCYLSMLFKKHFGETPLQYRRRSAGRNPP